MSSLVDSLRSSAHRSHGNGCRVRDQQHRLLLHSYRSPAGESANTAFRIGLGLAWGMHIVLRSIITWIMGRIQPVFPLESLGIPGSGVQFAYPSDFVAMALAFIIEVLSSRRRNAKLKRQASTHGRASGDGGCCGERLAIV